ncbi:MAG: hypothetical protein ACT4O3_04810 [Elusimicrobiota bacterium]
MAVQAHTRTDMPFRTLFLLVLILTVEYLTCWARPIPKNSPELEGKSKEELMEIALQHRWDRDLAAIDAAQQMHEGEKIRFLLQILASECKNPTNESPENPLPEHWKPAYTLSASIQGFIFDYLAFPKEVIHNPGVGIN